MIIFKSVRFYCKTVKQIFVHFIQHFCKHTNLHGFNYIYAAKSSLVKSSLWSFICMFCTTFCFLLMYLQFKRYRLNILATTISSTAYPVWENPFPAVTICNFNIVYKDNIYKFVQMLENQGIKPNKTLNFFSKLHYLFIPHSIPNEFKAEEYEEIIELLNNMGYNTEKLMKELAHPCHLLLRKCYWSLKEYNCSDLFYMIKTTEGYCCSFNYFGVTEEKNIDYLEDKYIFYEGGAGENSGLRVVIVTEEDQYFSQIKETYGVDVLVHNGDDYPSMSLSGSSLMVNAMLTISTLPVITVSDPDIQKLDTVHRNCWFPNEGNVNWSDRYSFQTCLNECKSNIILEICKCIPFYYHHSKNVKMCSLLDIDCLKKYRLEYSSVILSSKHINEGISSKIRLRVGERPRKCYCLPECSDIHYEHYIDKKWAPKIFGLEQYNTSILNVYFNGVTTMEYTRNIYISWDMFVASIGGIFGLCLGGSVMSLLEIIYHISDSIVYNFYNRKKKIKFTVGGKIHVSNKNTKRINRLKVLEKEKNYKRVKIGPVFEYRN